METIILAVIFIVVWNHGMKKHNREVKQINQANAELREINGGENVFWTVDPSKIKMRDTY